ncbi:MAG: phosphoribosylglycinamide formyltransferase [Desulfobacula sp.]|nr:phosphoribosylglycinamide formyltransferase [Desulfobacula sp.]
MKRKINIGTLISGGGTNLQAIIDASLDNSIDAKIIFTGSDNPGVKGLERAEKAGIDTFVVDYSKILSSCRQNGIKETDLPEDFNLNEILSKQNLFGSDTSLEQTTFFLKSRAIAEKQLLEKILAHEMDLLVLAGFMRVLTPYFIDRINTNPDKPKIMNIHPALLPSFPGTDGYGDTFAYGCKVGGCTVHYIDYGEDTGPIIGQKAFEIDDSDTLDDIKKKGLEKEWELYPQCIQKFADSK